MRRLTLDLPEHVFLRLLDRAEQERRHPRDEAAVLVERQLARWARQRPRHAESERRRLTLVGA